MMGDKEASAEWAVLATLAWVHFLEALAWVLVEVALVWVHVPTDRASLVTVAILAVLT